MNIAIIGYGQMGKEIEKISISRNHKIGKIIDTVMNVAAKFIVNKRSYRTLSNEIQSLSSSIKK